MDSEPRYGPLQLVVYGALGVVLLILGVRALGIGSATADPGVGEGPGSTGVRGQTAAEGPELEVSRGRDGPGELVVHVAGAVDEPGVYRFPAGARVADAVKRAGGASSRGMPGAINLAARLNDGQQVVVPERQPGGAGGGGAAAVGASGAGSGPISLGSATIADLETLDGIGPVTAQKIIDFRDANGGIGSIEELDAVSGIGPATIEALRDRLQP